MNKKYYVICPYGLVTGGPDALHQMVYYLKYIGKDADLVYINIDNYQKEIPKQYCCYTNKYILFNDIPDVENSCVIIPEFISYLAKGFKKSKVYIWWLSVDYNLNQTSLLYKLFFLWTIPIRLIKYKKIGFKRAKALFKQSLKRCKYRFKNEQINVEHLCASYYAYDYVSKRAKNNCRLCIEPVSKIFINNYDKEQEDKKQDIVLYNPKKCGKFVSKIIKHANQIQFVPLIGYGQNELIQIYKKAKLFIDFGPFPGAERMPKEAVINNCAIITGRNGASNYYGDVPIPDKYKFDVKLTEIKSIIEKIKFLLDNYETELSEFVEYKQAVINLENNFIVSLKKL